jgi:hypothetical protein
MIREIFRSFPGVFIEIHEEKCYGLRHYVRSEMV